MLTYEDRLIEVLNKCKDEQTLIGCSQWVKDQDTFIVGFVEALDDEGVMLNLVNTEGEPDGVWCGELMRITRFHYDTEYLRGIQSLYNNRNEVYSRISPVPRYVPGSENNHLDFMKQAMELKRIVTVTDEDENKLTGYVTDVGDRYAELQIIDSDNGSIDGFYVIDSNDIHHVQCASKLEMKLEFLNRKRYDLL